jgi:hypothetical protein
MGTPLIRDDGDGIITFHHALAYASGEADVTCGFRTGSTNVQECSDKAFDSWATNIMPAANNQLYLYSTRTQLMVSGAIQVWESFRSGFVNGAQTGQCLPSATAVLVQKHSGLAGRKNRGRMFMPGISASDVASGGDPNSLSATRLVTWQNAFTALYTDMIDSSPGPQLNPIILHPTGAIFGTAVQSFNVQARFGSQRGRNRD